MTKIKPDDAIQALNDAKDMASGGDVLGAHETLSQLVKDMAYGIDVLVKIKVILRWDGNFDYISESIKEVLQEASSEIECLRGKR